jgi:myo-inositol-1(or 4)-monophosphatase
MLDLAIRAARVAGRILVQHYHSRQPHQVHVKGLRDITTDADLAAEIAALEVIRAGCPGARLVAEESAQSWAEETDAPTWFVDPLDGTTNFARGLPMFSVSVAMVQGGVIQCGVVYDPLLEQLFSAARGQGAFLNDTRLHVSERAQLMESLVMLDWPRAQAQREQSARFLARLAPQVDAVRSRGSAALGLAGIAAGWGEAYFQFTLSPWDVAAGVLLVEEAGGRVTDLRGQPYHLAQKDWLATNGRVHAAFLAMEPLA